MLTSFLSCLHNNSYACLWCVIYLCTICIAIATVINVHVFYMKVRTTAEQIKWCGKQSVDKMWIFSLRVGYWGICRRGNMYREMSTWTSSHSIKKKCKERGRDCISKNRIRDHSCWNTVCFLAKVLNVHDSKLVVKLWSPNTHGLSLLWIFYILLSLAKAS